MSRADDEWLAFCSYCDACDDDAAREAEEERQRQEALEAALQEIDDYEPDPEPEPDPYISDPYYSTEQVILVNGVEIPFEKLWMYEGNPSYDIQIFGV